jgi:hypothetical protein
VIVIPGRREAANPESITTAREPAEIAVATTFHGSVDAALLSMPTWNDEPTGICCLLGRRAEALRACRAGEQLGRGAPSRLPLEIGVGERLPLVIADDEAGVRLLGGPGRREAAGLRHGSVVTAPPAREGNPSGSGRAVTARVRGAARNTRPFVSIFLTGDGPRRGKRSRAYPERC